MIGGGRKEGGGGKGGGERRQGERVENGLCEKEVDAKGEIESSFFD